MDIFNKSVRKVSIGVPTKPTTITFVPVLQKLPIKSILTNEERSESLTADKNVAASPERTPGQTMSDGQIFKAKIVFIKDILEGGKGSTVQRREEPKLKSPHDHMSLSLSRASPSVNAWSENTPKHPTRGVVSMETSVDKQRGLSQQKCHDNPGPADASYGCFADVDRTSPTCSADLFPTPASSRESILSEGSDKDRSWSAMPLSSVTSPASFSRSVSSCSSIRSGVFSPAVIQIKRHFLAPGSSLVHIPQTCFSSCDSLSSSVCPETPPARHRPPLTRLSLLTAILRKGRLPVLSPMQQRPYTPCWPVNPVTLSFCNACSAASSVASTPLQFSSQFSSSTSIDSQNHAHREPSRSITAPPTVESGAHKRTHPQTKKCSGQTCSSSELRWEHIVSPPPVQSSRLPRSPLPLFSNSKVVSQLKHEKTDSANTPHSSISKPSNTHTLLKDHTDDNFKKLISPSFKPHNESQTSASQKLSRQSNSSLSKLQLLSEQLRSLPASPPGLQPSQSRITASRPHTDAASPLPPSQNASRVGGGTSERSNPLSRSVTPIQVFQKLHSLSFSRYSPVALSGWQSPTSTSSPTPTPSPAPAVRDFTPSPSLSLPSTPSPRPGSGISDCSDREGKKRKMHKIKSSYKSLAAIPTNTLLLDQQVIDEEVEKEQRSHDALSGHVLDTHAEMCSPAQLRQQSEELYAVIDEILANSIPATSQSPVSNTGIQHKNSSFPKALGRETKYASLNSLPPSRHQEKIMMNPKKTKPGVIRPKTAIPSLSEKAEDKFNPNSLQQLLKQTLTERKKGKNVSTEERRRDLYTGSRGKTLDEERMPERRIPFSVCELHIKEPDEEINHLSKEALTSFSPDEKDMEAFETHI